jgi:ABC-type phosphate transport system permease subunit
MTARVASASQRLPKASNTVALEEKINMKEVKNDGRLFSAILGIIASLILVIFLSLAIWFIIAPSDTISDNPIYSITETETEWNTEHTEKF